jgi:arylsulfatase A-like enzyme
MSNTITRREFLTAVAAGAAAAALPDIGWAGDRKRPNIVVIVADDLGYPDLGVQGCKDIPTPNIDSIAKNGVRFTNGYVSCPVCSPTRAGLVTGRYGPRYGHEFNGGSPDKLNPKFGLPLTEITIADRMKAGGYVTGLVGKWHLGYKPEYHPMKRGFDEFFGFLNGAHSYVNSKATDPHPIYRGMTPVDEPEHLTIAFGREAVSFIERHKNEPFCLLLTFNSVHTPLETAPGYLEKFEHIPDPTRRVCAAQLAAMDDAVGRVLKKLRETGLEQDTLVFFFSDNGAPGKESNGSRNDPLSGFKGDLREGGIRIPFVAQWKGRIPAGKVYDKPVIQLDIHPTCLAAAGMKARIAKDKPLDGVNLLPFISGEKRSGVPHEVLYWRFGPQHAVRKGNYKLLFREFKAGLYDLSADIGEKNDLSAAKPDVLKELIDLYDKWNAELMEPLWKGAAATPEEAGQERGYPAAK